MYYLHSKNRDLRCSEVWCSEVGSVKTTNSIYGKPGEIINSRKATKLLATTKRRLERRSHGEADDVIEEFPAATKSFSVFTEL